MIRRRKVIFCSKLCGYLVFCNARYIWFSQERCGMIKCILWKRHNVKMIRVLEIVAISHISGAKPYIYISTAITNVVWCYYADYIGDSNKHILYRNRVYNVFLEAIISLNCGLRFWCIVHKEIWTLEYTEAFENQTHSKVWSQISVRFCAPCNIHNPYELHNRLYDQNS